MAEDPFGYNQFGNIKQQLLAAQPNPAPHVADPRWMAFLVKYYQKTIRTEKQAEEYLDANPDKRYVIWPYTVGIIEETIYKFNVSNKKTSGEFEHEYLAYKYKEGYLKGYSITVKEFYNLNTDFPEATQGGGGKRRSRRRRRHSTAVN